MSGRERSWSTEVLAVGLEINFAKPCGFTVASQEFDDLEPEIQRTARVGQEGRPFSACRPTLGR